jgi:hypothetical protein
MKISPQDAESIKVGPQYVEPHENRYARYRTHENESSICRTHENSSARCGTLGDGAEAIDESRKCGNYEEGAMRMWNPRRRGVLTYEPSICIRAWLTMRQPTDPG